MYSGENNNDSNNKNILIKTVENSVSNAAGTNGISVITMITNIPMYIQYILYKYEIFLIMF